MPAQASRSLAATRRAFGLARGELRQLARFFGSYRSRSAVARQYRAIRHLHGARLRWRRRVPGSVWAVSVVRDEADIVETTLRHLLNQGVTGVLIADNGSTDGTYELLQRLSTTLPEIRVLRDSNPAHDQAFKQSWLSQLAWRAGADWIVPFDGDEFWFATGTRLAQYLAGVQANRVWASFHHMTPTAPIRAGEELRDREFIVDATVALPGKMAFRAHPLVFVGPGNHYANRVGGTATGLHIAHAQYRSPEQLARKVRQGAASSKLTGEDLSWFAPHWQAGAGLSDAEILEVWGRLTRGLPAERLQYWAWGPMVKLAPLGWPHWDPDGQLPVGLRGHPDGTLAS